MHPARSQAPTRALTQEQASPGGHVHQLHSDGPGPATQASSAWTPYRCTAVLSATGGALYRLKVRPPAERGGQNGLIWAAAFVPEFDLVVVPNGGSARGFAP